MFYVNNIQNTKERMTIEVRYKEHMVSFVIGSIVSPRSKEDLRNPYQMTLINGYIAYKGDEFAKELFKRYVEADEKTINSIRTKAAYPLPGDIVGPILDMFDLSDMFHYVKFVAKVQPPKDLMDSFDPQIELDGRGSRVQTYIKDDYLELVALCLVLKAALGPMCNYGHIKKEEISNNIEYILLNFIRRHPIFKCNAIDKLLGFIDKMIDNPMNTPETAIARLFEKQVPMAEIRYLILGILVFQKLALATILDDTSDKNIVTIIFNYGNSKLKASADTSKVVRDKKQIADNESATGDKESIFESSRILADLSAGTQIEINTFVRDIPTILSQLPKAMVEKIDMQATEDANNFTKTFLTGGIEISHISFLAIIFKKIINPKALDYVNIDGIRAMQSIAFGLLWGLGYKSLALYMVSKKAPEEESAISINPTANRARITQEIRDELDKLYPAKRVINADTHVNVAEEWINEITKDIINKEWITAAPEFYENEGKTNGAILTPNLKIELGNFLIEIEGLLNYDKN